MLKKPYKVIDNCSIYGNNHWKPLAYGWELSESELSKFDYLDNPQDDFTGFRYNGNLYDLGEFMRIDKNNPFYGFADGYHGDSYFSGILVKFDESREAVKVYTYIS